MSGPVEERLQELAPAGASCVDGVCSMPPTAPEIIINTTPEGTQTMSEDSIDLATRAAISDLLHRYSTGIDTRDWTLFRSVFTNDARIDYGPALGTFNDADAFTATMSGGHDSLGSTIHRISNIVITPGTPLRVRSYGDNINLEPGNQKGHHGAAYYDDEIVHTNDGLKVAARTLTMVLFEPVTTNVIAGALPE